MADSIEQLLEHMSLEEKIAQTDMGMGVRFFDRTHPAYFGAVHPEGEIDKAALDQMIGPDGMGFIHSVYSSGKIANKLHEYCRNYTRLKIPPIIICEALHGVHMPDATVFPVPLALAATFNPQIVKTVGSCIGYEARATGHREVLNPNLDLAREPRWGRMEETFGEDVHLSSVMGVAIVQGLQGHEPFTVAAELKHYAVHGIAEGGLNAAPARAGMREILLSHIPVFQAAVQEGGALNAMASYNSIDGIPLMNHTYFLSELLKGTIGLKGYIRSDFAGIPRLVSHHGVCKDDLHAVGSAISAGIDTQGFDYSNQEWRRLVKEAVETGLLSLKRLDDAVRRILTVKKSLGLFDDPFTDEKDLSEVLRGQESLGIAYRAATESICLLENDGILPLSSKGEEKEKPRIALIGPFAMLQPLGGYSPIPYSFAPKTVADVLEERGYQVSRSYGCSACGRTSAAFPFSWFIGDVKFEYYLDRDQQGEPVAVQYEKNIDQMWLIKNPVSALPDSGWSITITGRFKVDFSTISKADMLLGALWVQSSDDVELLIDNEKVIAFETPLSTGHRDEYHQGFVGSSGNERRLPFLFSSGAEHTFQMGVRRSSDGHRLVLGYELPDDHIQEARMAAGEADLVILSCGDDQNSSGEGYDRSSLALPGRQEELIKHINKVSDNTILLLHTGRPVVVEPFRDSLRAILQCWFSGEAGAEAIVDALEGAINPSGKSPISWPRSTGHIPWYYSRLPGTSSGNYFDGTYESRYPLGHGLSYTSFTISDLAVRKYQEGFMVSCRLSNTGNCYGQEVVQLYVVDRVSTVVTPPLELKSFVKEGLEPGRNKPIMFNLPIEAFSLINREMQRVVEPGDFDILIGTSSRDIHCRSTITIREEIRL